MSSITACPTPVFQLDQVHYAYQDVAALRGISLQIQAGQRIALLGANGSGKSTLLRLLDALYFADQGTVTAFGQVLTETGMQAEQTSHAFRRRVGLVFQNPDVQLFNPTVFDELAFGPLQLGWDKAHIRQRIDAMLAQFGIQDLRARSPHRLSGGEKKRVALASVLITEPEVLLLDEPSAGLDPASQGDIIRFMRACRGTQRTLITATHDLAVVPETADYCFVLQQGQVIAAGTPEQILSDAPLLAESHLSYQPQPG
jgi:cobalt/nickel transport system ATP-binding protein